MKNGILLIIMCFPFTLNAANLELHVSRFTNNKGVMRGYLFSQSQQDHFPVRLHKADYSVKASIDGEKVDLLIGNVSPGIYAAFVFHDENNNGLTDHSWLGFPTERFGYYSNYQVRIMPPDFVDVAFEVKETDMSMNVKLQKY